ncbi:cytidine deaminase [Vibrio sp. 10N.247.311.51]|uniref:cytidine deaminase family protein n=1 Tax=Vibrio sp. 10N.247.311.51 TaxID=3229996 RepID=UPI00354C3A95
MFEHLVELAKLKMRKQEFSGRISCGQVSAAIETSAGNLYSGVCIDTSCSLGICAERNAIGSMVTEGEFQITKLVCVKGDDFILPCGACLELLMQLHPQNSEIAVLINQSGDVLKLNQLMPHWWGNT